MTQATPRSRRSPAGTRARSRRPRRSAENSDVLVSAVISTYLLTHLHHVLQRAEYGASQEGALLLKSVQRWSRVVSMTMAGTLVLLGVSHDPSHTSHPSKPSRHPR